MWGDTAAGPDRERAQVFTLEGVFAALVIMVSVLFALQTVTAVPGGGGSVSTGANENVAQSALSAVDDETLRDAVLQWDPSSSPSSFHCTPTETEYHPAPPDSLGNCQSLLDSGSLPPNDFGVTLGAQLGDGYEYNVVLRYSATSGQNVESQRMVYQGQPGTGAVRARTSVPLADDAVLRDASGDETGTSVSGNLYADDASGNDIYNVIHVEVVAWQS